MSAIRNLRNMLVFHINIRNQQIVAEFLLHCNSLTIGARNFYIFQTADNNWSTRELKGIKRNRKPLEGAS